MKNGQSPDRSTDAGRGFSFERYLLCFEQIDFLSSYGTATVLAIMEGTMETVLFLFFQIVLPLSIGLSFLFVMMYFDIRARKQFPEGVNLNGRMKFVAKIIWLGMMEIVSDLWSDFRKMIRRLKFEIKDFVNENWIRKNEFHPSLSLDVDAMKDMSPEREHRYRLDLMRRRDIAHKRDIEPDWKSLKK